MVKIQFYTNVILLGCKFFNTGGTININCRIFLVLGELNYQFMGTRVAFKEGHCATSLERERDNTFFVV